MTPKKHAVTALCADLRPDDGIPPRVLKRQRQKQTKNRQHSNHRALQFCKAAQRTLDGALACIGGDELMSDLNIAAVEPLRGVLLVVVSKPSLALDEIAEIEQHLQQVSGLLRAAIAGDTHRKRVPHLQFRVVPADA